MTAVAQAYAQARLQARLSLRPEPAQWQMIDTAGDLAQALEAAGRTGLGPLVASLDRNATPHDIERALRAAWAGQVGAVASWAPARLRPALLWLRPLPHLRPLEAWQAGLPVPGWARQDPVFAALWAGDGGARMPWGIDAFRARPDPGTPVAVVWRREFDARLRRGGHAPLATPEIAALFARWLGDTAERSAPQPSAEALVRWLGALVRRRQWRPEALVAGLGIVGLDLERLRGALLGHAAFAPEPA